jgi:hypothetical protein
VTTAFIFADRLLPLRRIWTVALTLLALGQTQIAWAQVERMYFPAVDNVRDVLVQHINAETERIDMSAWYLTDGEVVNALLRRHNEGLPIRLLGDRGSIFEIDVHTKNAFYRLANAGLPIRLRVHPTWYPEIDHWKATIFVGQNILTFGSANYTPFELAPHSADNYKDETVLFTDDAELVAAFKMKFDKMWADTTGEPQSLIPSGPYFLDWEDACARESACADFATQYPNPAPMTVDLTRLEPDAPLPADMGWGQGPEFNNRVVAEINAENTRVDFVIYRLTVDNITEALLAKHQSGVPVRIILEPNEYLNKKWPEFWLTHANMDRLWAAGVQMKQRVHAGLTHMKMLVTSRVATNASSNLAAAWQRDHNYFVPADRKPELHDAMRDRFETMWTHPTDFADFVPLPPDTPTLAAPANTATGVSVDTALTWNRAPFAVSYDVYLGTTANNMVKVGNVAAVLNNNPPLTYSFTPATPLQPATTYHWKVVALTNASSVLASAVAHSNRWTFKTGGTVGPPPAPGNPQPANGATAVSTTPQLGWSAAPVGTTFNVDFGTQNPPPQVATGLTSSSYSPGGLAPSTTYYWRVTAVSDGGSTTGNLWSFTTGTSGGTTEPGEIVIYASDVATRVGGWMPVNDPSAAGGVLLRHDDAGYANTANALASPVHYFEAQFEATANTLYRVWVRLRAKDNSKWNDSVFLQFSDSIGGSGNPRYRIGTTSALTENLWTCSDCQSTGWGWSRHAYWLNDTGEVRFQTSGTHTIRVQTREDGVDLDQIVISPVTYVQNAPGPVSNDNTIVPKPVGGTPAPPGAPTSPNPANGATTGTSLTLTWSAGGATRYDVRFGSTNPPPLVSQNQAAASFNVAGLGEGATYYWQVVAENDNGSTTGPVWSFTTAAGGSASSPEIVIYAADIPAAALHGGWTHVQASESPLGVRLETPNDQFSTVDAPLANPTHYVDVTFDAPAGVPYALWLRLRAKGNNKPNDSVWVQFSDARAGGAPVYPLNTTSGLLVNLAVDARETSLSGWGWQNGAYWLNQATTVTFANSGSHTMRVQVREDGVFLDQIVLSPGTYLNSPPGPARDDSTIVPRP